MTSKPASSKTREHRPVAGEHLGDEALDPVRRGAAASCSSRRVPMPAALQLVGDGERDLGADRIAQPDVARERDDAAVVAERADQRPALVPVRVDEGLDELRRHAQRAVEALVDALRREPRRRTRRAPRRPRAPGGRRRSVPPSRRMTSRAGPRLLGIARVSPSASEPCVGPRPERGCGKPAGAVGLLMSASRRRTRSRHTRRRGRRPARPCGRTRSGSRSRARARPAGRRRRSRGRPPASSPR